MSGASEPTGIGPLLRTRGPSMSTLALLVIAAFRRGLAATRRIAILLRRQSKARVYLISADGAELQQRCADLAGKIAFPRL